MTENQSFPLPSDQGFRWQWWSFLLLELTLIFLFGEMLYNGWLTIDNGGLIFRRLDILILILLVWQMVDIVYLLLRRPRELRLEGGGLLIRRWSGTRPIPFAQIAAARLIPYAEVVPAARPLFNFLVNLPPVLARAGGICRHPTLGRIRCVITRKQELVLLDCPGANPPRLVLSPADPVAFLTALQAYLPAATSTPPNAGGRD